jgi:hypothetical protein
LTALAVALVAVEAYGSAVMTHDPFRNVHVTGFILSARSQL